jgi:hypothetical protein
MNDDDNGSVKMMMMAAVLLLNVRVRCSAQEAVPGDVVL